MTRLLVVLGLFLGAPPAGAAGLEVSGAWIRLPPPGAGAAAAYLVLRNPGGTPEVLTGAESPAFGRVMMHRSVLQDGVARMRHVDELEIGPGRAVRFEPGGLHLMLMAPRRALRAGEAVELVLLFRGGARLPVRFPVRRQAP